MALGGGTFTAQNKVLPGAYINFVSQATATTDLSDRGHGAIAMELDWGEDDKIITLTQDDFARNCVNILGYAPEHEKMRDVREAMKNLTVLYIYKLTGGGNKASNTFATAKCTGTRGNDLKVAVQKNVDDQTKFDVKLYLDTALVDAQTVAAAAELVDNDFVAYKKDTTLAVTASTPLTGGTNGEASLAGHQAFLNKIESYPSVNAVGYAGTDDATKNLYIAFAKRMRDEVGIKLQAVVYNKLADYEGVVNVKNVADADNEASLVYWTMGVVAGTAINASATNKVYDGEYSVEAEYTQNQLERAVKAGEFVLHRVGSDIRVLTDINSLVTLTAEKGRDFQSNQTIRVLDQIGTSVASIFANEYVGVVPNDEDGRTLLWDDIVSLCKELDEAGAIEGFVSENIEVLPGADKKSVVINAVITPVNAMEKLYMTVYVN